MTMRAVFPEGWHEAGGSEALQLVVRDFYRKAVQDPLLGPVFKRVIGPYPGAGWPVHLARLDGFWRAVTGGPHAYRGQPGLAHQGLGLTPAHFERWLMLWDETARELLPPDQAQALLVAAQRMATNMQRMAIALSTQAPS